MHDCADMLPYLLDLDNIAKSENMPSTEQVQWFCACYEERMIERAFAWVEKSGGHSVLVRAHQSLSEDI